MIAPWVKGYISPPIPYKHRGRDRETGTDCWGLARLIQREQFDVDLPDYAERYITAYDEEEVSALIKDEVKACTVAVPFAQMIEGDLILLRTNKGTTHIGVYAGEENGSKWVIHQSGFADSCLTRLNDPFMRVAGVFRWKP